MAKITSPPATPPPESPVLADQSTNDEPEVSAMNADSVRNSLRDADEIKQEGNEHFRSKRWTEALVSYRTALAKVPPREEENTASSDKGKKRQATPPSDNEAATAPKNLEGDEAPTTLARLPMTELELECAKVRSVINANIAACHVKLVSCNPYFVPSYLALNDETQGEHKESVEACTKSLLDDPTYAKALQRRATSNLKINSWSSLTSAQEDYTSLLEILPKDSPQHAEARRELTLLKPRVEKAQKAETAEMLDKLKGLGNSLLGNFGLSTDNFKFEPNGQGGYSMNFVK
ncbi:hypothetical protein HWV62_19831 [Athelia sp. TMB]|nr:hypothetical protein HWV62_19831 [Athelia sp. TMB]